MCSRAVLVLTVLLLVCTTKHVWCAISEAQLRSAAKLIRNNCQGKTKATDEQVDQLAKGLWDNDPVTECYIFCMMNMYKLVDKNTGKFNEASARKQLPQLPKDRQEPSMKSMTNCMGKDEGENKCQVAYNFAKCFYFDNPENFFDI